MITLVRKKMCGQAATCWLAGCMALFGADLGVSRATPLVTIDSWLLRATASDEIDGPGMQDLQWTDVQWPFHATQEASAGGSSVHATYSFNSSGNRTIFDFSTLLQRDGGPRPVGTQEGGDYARFFAELYITPSETAYYAIDGEASLVGAQEITYATELKAVQSNEQLFWNAQVSRSTPNQMFSVTGSDGDVLNTSAGTPTGTLMAGIPYRFRVSLHILPRVPDQGAGAAGEFRLTLLPEPSSVWLMLMPLIPSLRRTRAM